MLARENDIKTARQAKVTQNKAITANRVILITLLALISLPVFAAGGQPWDNMVQTAIDVFTGGLGRSLAILVIIGLGIAAFFGKLSWRLAGGFIGGIVLIFGAAAIVDFFIAGV